MMKGGAFIQMTEEVTAEFGEDGSGEGAGDRRAVCGKLDVHVIHVSGRFRSVKVNRGGMALYKTRQIVTGRNKHPARWMSGV